MGNKQLDPSNYRSTVVLNRVYKVFLHCEDFLNWDHRLGQLPLARFMVALEMKFEWTLYLHNEGYKTDDHYDLP